MPSISMTDFVDFLIKVGPPRLTKVKQVKSRKEYEPAIDFWRPLRIKIINYHKGGETIPSKLDFVKGEISDSKKIKRYEESLKGYRTFLGRKKPRWFEPTKNECNLGELMVRVNPELGLEFKGKKHIVKLYFKDERLNKQKSRLLLTLMEYALRDQCKDDETLCILDVNSAKLLQFNGEDDSLLPLLIAESLSFVSIWNSI